MADVISERYKARFGKVLFIRFPARLPEDEVEFQKQAQALSPLIIKSIKPRQKHARFCYAEFSSQEDRDKALKDIRKAVKTDEKFKGIVALIPRTESEGFVDELIKKKLKSKEAKRAKARLKRASKRAADGSREFTSMVVVRNLPANVSMVEMRSLFPNAVDIQMNSKGDKKNKTPVATVTLPSSYDAREIVKKKFSLDGTDLSIRFHVGRTKEENKRRPIIIQGDNDEDNTETESEREEN